MKTIYQFLYTYCILQGALCIAGERDFKQRAHWEEIPHIIVSTKQPRSIRDHSSYALTPPTARSQKSPTSWKKDLRRSWSFEDEYQSSSDAGGVSTVGECPSILSTKVAQVLAGYGAYPSSSAESSRAPSPSKRQSPIPWAAPLDHAALDHSNSSRSSSPFKYNTTRPALPFPSSCDTSRAPSPNGAHSGASSTQPSPQVSPRTRAMAEAIMFPRMRGRRVSDVGEEPTSPHGSQAGSQRHPISAFGGNYTGRRHSQ